MTVTPDNSSTDVTTTWQEHFKVNEEIKKEHAFVLDTKEALHLVLFHIVLFILLSGLLLSLIITNELVQSVEMPLLCTIAQDERKNLAGRLCALAPLVQQTVQT